jgi:sugar O-acyltransferase (sialic acid O-acetyltransferase NeuD family)
MLLYGAGGHAKTIIACAHSHGIEVKGIFDDNLSRHTFRPIPILGPYDPSAYPYMPIIISIGSNHNRNKVSTTIAHGFGQLVHATALIDSSAEMAEGTVCLHHSVVQASAMLGRHVIVNTGAIVEHDCVVGDFVHIGPAVVLCGHVRVGENTMVGAGTVVAPNLEIGKNCMIAAGSVITTNIPAGAIVRGNPGRIVKIIS